MMLLSNSKQEQNVTFHHSKSHAEQVQLALQKKLASDEEIVYRDIMTEEALHILKYPNYQEFLLQKNITFLDVHQYDYRSFVQMLFLDCRGYGQRRLTEQDRFFLRELMSYVNTYLEKNPVAKYEKNFETHYFRINQIVERLKMTHDDYDIHILQNRKKGMDSMMIYRSFQPHKKRNEKKLF